MATKSVKGKGRFTFDQLQEVERATEMRVLEDRRPGKPLLSINGDYLIAPSTTSEDMLNDVGCLLEAAMATIDSINDGLQEEGSQMAAEASRNVPRMLYGVLYQLEMVKNLTEAAFPAKAGES